MIEEPQNSETLRFRTPEATVFINLIEGSDTDIEFVQVFAGKAGSMLAAQADGMARLAGAAVRSGADPSYLGRIISGISHDRSNGGSYDASSVVDALGKALMEVEDEEHP